MAEKKISPKPAAPKKAKEEAKAQTRVTRKKVLRKMKKV